MNTLALMLVPFSVVSADQQSVVVVLGAQGDEEYGEQFVEWAEAWRQAAERGQANYSSIGKPDDESDDKEKLKERIAAEREAGTPPLWLVFIGHGTFDGKSAKFNLRGADVSATELAQWLEDFPRPLAVINCASSSGPFINRLAGPNRVIVTATKSGHEYNFARFGQHMSRAIANPKADLDKDEQTSLLEAFVSASAKVAEFYEQEARLATEHALIDDNGDGLGTPADWFRGVRSTRTPKAGVQTDGLRANQLHLIRSDREASLSDTARAERDELEQNINRLRDNKPNLSEEEYYDQLEQYLLELARVYGEMSEA